MKCVVVGAGPAGMMASCILSKNGHDVVLIEKNEKLGKKLYITGKGRCNITNNSDRETILNNIVTNSKFAISSLSKFTPQDTINFFEQNGTPLKTERGNRVFPQSDKSSDIIKCFEKQLKNVQILLNTLVQEILVKDNVAYGVKTTQGDILADKIIVATGGVSYPLTGSTGDGYKWAKKFGHNIIELKPGLNGLVANNTSVLSGLSLKNVKANIYADDKLIYSEFGEMLFTHKGVSGPIILSACSFINKYYVNKRFNKNIVLKIDLKPALNEETIQERLIKDFSLKPNMDIKNLLAEYMPKALIAFVLNQANISNCKKCNSISKEERGKLIDSIKNLKFIIKDIDKIEFAIITSGGIDVKQISPKDMQSKLVSNLYFIGEILDVDALTGGFNLQFALSSAFACASSINS